MVTEFYLGEDENSLKMDGGGDCIKNVNVLIATKLCT